MHGVLEQGRLHDIVRVQEVEPFAACEGSPVVARRAFAWLGFLCENDAMVLAGELLEDFGSAVGRVVVNADDLDVAHGLRKRALNGSRKVALCIVARDDD